MIATKGMTGVLVDTHSGSDHSAIVTAVNGDGTVNAANVPGTNSQTSVAFVAVGGTPPTTGFYFQAIY